MTIFLNRLSQGPRSHALLSASAFCVVAGLLSFGLATEASALAVRPEAGTAQSATSAIDAAVWSRLATNETLTAPGSDRKGTPQGSPAGAGDLVGETHLTLAAATADAQLRLKLAQFRPERAATGQEAMLQLVVASTPVQEPAARVQVADSGQAKSDALDAIQAAAPVVAPVPAPAPHRLGYARSDSAPSNEPVGRTRVADAEMECLATAVYYEARGESREGQVAVAQVILNRAASGRYPDSICGVVYQNESRRHACQFSFACDGVPERMSDRRSWARAKDVADAVVSGRELIEDVKTATHYHADYVSPYWAPKMRRLSKIGTHVFYRG